MRIVLRYETNAPVRQLLAADRNLSSFVLITEARRKPSMLLQGNIAVAMHKKTRRLLYALAVLRLSTFSEGRAQVSVYAPADLETYYKSLASQWRLVLCPAPTAENADLVAQRAAFEAHAEALRARDVVVWYLPADRLSRKDRDWLRLQFALSADAFAMVLVGKDGTVKHRADAPITTDELSALIDQMPMRLLEMQQRP